MTINVMGATGQLGRRIVHALIEQGVAPVTGISIPIELLTGTPPTDAKTYLTKFWKAKK